MVLNDVAWTHLEAGSWPEAASVFDRLVTLCLDAPGAKDGSVEPYAAVYAYEAALCFAQAGDHQRTRDLLERVPVLLDSEPGRAKTASWGAERYVKHKAGRLTRSMGEDVPPAYNSALLELLLLWDRADALPPKRAQDALALLQQDGGLQNSHMGMVTSAALIMAVRSGGVGEGAGGGGGGGRGGLEEAAAQLDAAIGASADLAAAVGTVPGAEEEDVRHVFVVARYLRAKLLLSTLGGVAAPDGGEMVAGEGGEGVGGAECTGSSRERARVLVAEAAASCAKQVHMAVNLEFKLHALADI